MVKSAQGTSRGLQGAYLQQVLVQGHCWPRAYAGEAHFAVCCLQRLLRDGKLLLLQGCLFSKCSLCLQRNQEEHEKQSRAHKVELKLLHQQMDEACGAFDCSLQVRPSSTLHSVGEAAQHTRLSGTSAQLAAGAPRHALSLPDTSQAPGALDKRPARLSSIAALP